MTLTPEQRKAVADAIRDRWHSSTYMPDWDALADAAITAAAGVGDSDIVLDKNGTFWDRRFPNELIDHTIERCAQVAEKMTKTSEFWRDDIAAAIRALKSESKP